MSTQTIEKKEIFRNVKTYLWEFVGFLVVLACPPFLKVAELEDFDLQLNGELFDRHGVNKFLHLQGNHFESPNQQMENLNNGNFKHYTYTVIFENIQL